MIERANEGHVEQRASREAGHGAHWGRRGGKLGPNLIDVEVVARGVESVRGSQKRTCSIFFQAALEFQGDGEGKYIYIYIYIYTRGNGFFF